MKFIILVPIFISLLYAGDSFLEGYTFFTFLTIFLVLISPIIIGFTNKKTIISFFVILIISIGIDSSISYTKDYTPSVAHWFQKPYKYGVYKEMEEVKCLKNKNITSFIGNVPIASPYVAATNNEIIWLQYSNAYKSKQLLCRDKLKIDDLSNIKSIYLVYQWDIGGFHILVSDNKSIEEGNKFLVYTLSPKITKLGYMTHKEYLDRYKVHYTHFENNLFHSKKSSTDIKSSKDVGEIYAIIDKVNKQFTIWGKDTKYNTTHLPYSPKFLLYDSYKDLIYIVYEEIDGLHVLENKYTDDYTQVQNSIKLFIDGLIKPKWDKPDLSKIHTKVNKEKLEKIIQLFNPYTKKSHQVLQYTVLSYDDNLSIVKTFLLDKDQEFIFYLEKIDKWEIVDIKFESDFPRPHE